MPRTKLVPRDPKKGEVWSVFLLDDGGTWSQPSFRIPHDMTEREFCESALRTAGGFHATGSCPDEDCPDEYARNLMGVN